MRISGLESFKELKIYIAKPGLDVKSIPNLPKELIKGSVTVNYEESMIKKLTVTLRDPMKFLGQDSSIMLTAATQFMPKLGELNSKFFFDTQNTIAALSKNKSFYPLTSPTLIGNLWCDFVGGYAIDNEEYPLNTDTFVTFTGYLTAIRPQWTDMGFPEVTLVFLGNGFEMTRQVRNYVYPSPSSSSGERDNVEEFKNPRVNNGFTTTGGRKWRLVNIDPAVKTWHKGFFEPKYEKVLSSYDIVKNILNEYGYSLKIEADPGDPDVEEFKKLRWSFYVPYKQVNKTDWQVITQLVKTNHRLNIQYAPLFNKSLDKKEFIIRSMKFYKNTADFQVYYVPKNEMFEPDLDPFTGSGKYLMLDLPSMDINANILAGKVDFNVTEDGVTQITKLTPEGKVFSYTLDMEKITQDEYANKPVIQEIVNKGLRGTLSWDDVKDYWLVLEDTEGVTKSELTAPVMIYGWSLSTRTHGNPLAIPYQSVKVNGMGPIFDINWLIRSVNHTFTESNRFYSTMELFL